MKKYSWIVALLLALAFSFISCGVAPVEIESPIVTYTEVALDNGMNVWAGGKDQQQGWATGAGFKFLGVGDKLESAKDAGYKADDFKAAQFLQFELQPGAPKGGVQIIWGAAEGNDKNISGWNSNKLTTDSGDILDGVGVKVEKGEGDKGDIWKVELKKALANFGQLKNADEVKILLQYYTDKGIPSLYVENSAKLLIPNIEVPFKEITKLTLKTNEFPYTSSLKLEAVFEPEDATEQLVIWSIVGWTPKGGATELNPTRKVTGNPEKPNDPVLGGSDGKTPIPNSSYNASKYRLLTKVDFRPQRITLIDPIKATDYSVYPPIDVTYYNGLYTDSTWFQYYLDAVVDNNSTPGDFSDDIVRKADLLASLLQFGQIGKSKDTIYAPDEEDSLGTVTIQALVPGGGKDGADYKQEFTVTVKEILKVNFTTLSTNVGVTDVKSSDNKPIASVAIIPPGTTIYSGITTSQGGYTLMYEAKGSTFESTDADGDNPAWSGAFSGTSVYAYFQVTLDAGKKLSDYKAIMVSMQAVLSGERWKNVNLFALGTKPTGALPEANEGTKGNWIRIGVVGDDSNAGADFDSHYNGYNAGSMIHTQILTIDEDKVKGTAADVNNPYIVIYIHAPAWNGTDKNGYKFFDIAFLNK